MVRSYDAVVLGVGGVGSAAFFQLARRGVRVLGIEQFGVAHNRGSSHGETRAIRKAYFEHPDYVPLLVRAYSNWRELQSLCGRELLVEQGLLEIGPPDGELICGVRRACQTHGLPIEEIPESQLGQRFPGFRLPAGSVALFEADGGYLNVEQCVQSYCRLGKSLGGTLLTNTPVMDWRINDRGVTVMTPTETFETGHLVVTAGAWAGRLLDNLGLPLRVLRKHLHWYSVEPGSYARRDGSPVFFYQTPAGCYYGFPDTGIPSSRTACIKLAEHSGGEEVAQPSRLQQTKDPQEVARVEDFLSAAMPNVRLTAVHHEVCMYTVTPDEHFLVDHHPESSLVSFAAGLSGHGFKFASVLGEILADKVERGVTELPIEFLSVDRLL